MFDKKKFKSLKERFENTILFFIYKNAAVVFEEDVKVVSEISDLRFDILEDGTFYLMIPKDKTDQVIEKVNKSGYRVGICEPIQYM